MSLSPTPTFEIRDYEVGWFGACLRSRLDRCTHRTLRLLQRDDEIASRWLLRCARRKHVQPVDNPVWSYTPDDRGPWATQTVKVRAIEPDEEDRERLVDLRLPPNMPTFRLPRVRGSVTVFSEEDMA